MAENKTENNKICASRVKEVIKESGLTQEQFAEQILFKKPEHVSYICTGKRPLSLKDAEIIIQRYPNIRLDWLLGKSQYKTDLDLINSICDNNSERHRLIETLFELHGYHVWETVFSDTQTMKVIKSPDGIEHYFFPEEYSRLTNSVDDFIEGQLMLKCKRTALKQKE